MNPTSLAPVIVGVDGSASSMSAVRTAATFAALYGLPLRVVHAFNWLPRSADPVDAHPGATANDLLQRAVTAAHSVSPGLAVDTRLLEGAPSSTLLRQAHAAALLAVGDGGLSAHVCLPTHTSAVHLATHASCSVLVARAWQSFDGAIVVGVNGSPASERALDFAFDTAARGGADLVVVRAGPSAAADADDEPPADLADLVATRENKYHVEARTVTSPDDPVATLLAESRRASLLVVGARGRQRYGGLLGSVAQTVLHHSHASVILVRGMITPSPARSGNGPAAAAIA